MSLREALAPKSDQLNADDLIGDVTKIITITSVSVKVGSEQPIIINYQGDNGKPWKPSKGMGRVLMALWGESENDFIGRSIELYRDASVKFAGDEVGGIRIKSMSHINGRQILSQTISRGRKQKYVVNELIVPNNQVSESKPQLTQAEKDANAKEAFERIENTITFMMDEQNYNAFINGRDGKIYAALEKSYPDYYSELTQKLTDKKTELNIGEQNHEINRNV